MTEFERGRQQGLADAARFCLDFSEHLRGALAKPPDPMSMSEAAREIWAVRSEDWIAAAREICAVLAARFPLMPPRPA